MSLTAIALGVALVVAFGLMNKAVLRSFTETVDAMAGRAAFRVVAGEQVTFSEDLVERLNSIDGVEVAVPLVRAATFPDDDSGELLTVHGVDLTHDAAVRLYHTVDGTEEVIDDLVAFLNQPDSIVVGRRFAEERGLHHDSKIDLVTPRGVKTFTIRGLLDAQGVARTLSGRLVVMDLFAAQRAYTADRQVNQIDVVVEDGADVESVKEAVRSRLPAGLRLDEPSVRKDVIRKTVRGFQAVLTAFSVVAIFAGFVICYGRLRIVFEARTWEIGLLRAVGLRRAVVFVELLKESVLLGTAGAILGIPVGIAAAYLGLPILSQATAINFRLPVTSAEAAVRPDVILIGLGAGLLAAMTAALFPALRLVRTQPVAALTRRGRETPSFMARSRLRPAPLVLFATIVGLVVLQQVFDLPVLGHITTVLVAIMSCVLAGPFVRRGTRYLEVVWRRIFGPTGKFAAGQLAREGRRTALTVATLGVGLGAILLFGMLGWSFERSLVSQLSRRMTADLVISSPFMSGGYVSAPLDEGLIGELRRVPGVALTGGHLLKDVPYASGEVAVAAVDPELLVDTRLSDWPLDRGAHEDALRSVANGDAVLVTRSFAHHFETRPGDRVRLTAPGGPVELEVAGVTGGLLENGVVMSRQLYRSTWNDPHVSWVYVAFEPGANRASVEKAIARELGEKYRLRIQSSPEIIDYFAGEVRRAFSALYLMEGIIFLLVLVGIGDTLAAGVIERTREFGMMRAVGLHRSQLFKTVMLEGAGIAFMGLLLAVGVGLVLGTFWVEVQFPAMLGWKFDLHFPMTFSLVASAITVMLCLLGSLLPAIRAASISVPTALRYE